MGISQQDRKMEGWLYLIRSNRLGLQFSRKRYFVLDDNSLNCYKNIPTSSGEDPIRSALIDSCIRVTDNGRESINRSVFFIFTLYSSSSHDDQLKLGARSPEEAAGWIRTLTEAALKECPIKQENVVACSKRRWQSFRLSRSKGRSRMHSIDWTAYPSVHTDPTTSDVIAPSPWTIFGCKNGLRLFKESEDGDFCGKHWDDHPAIMAVGVVDATSEAIFRTVMSLGASRSEWDFCFSHGRVVEHLDGHTDIIHKKLKGDWLPWCMRQRDLLLRRYWRREDDGTYVILYHSVFHHRCPPERGYVRACLKSGGYVISPVNHGKQSVVKHMLAIDWKFWKSYLFTSSAKYITIQMLGIVAALRELFRAKHGNYVASDFSSGELAREIGLPQIKRDINEGVQSVGETSGGVEFTREPQKSLRPTHSGGSFLQLNDPADEFFDFPDESEYEQHESMWTSDAMIHSQEHRQPKLSTAACFVKRLHELAVQKRGYVDLQEDVLGDSALCSYGSTLQQDRGCTVACSWSTSDPSTFLIRSETYLQDRHKDLGCFSPVWRPTLETYIDGCNHFWLDQTVHKESDPSTFLIRSETYLQDRHKIKANGTLMKMVAADWLKSDKREDDLAGRPGGVVQKYASQGGNEFFFIVNIQVPGSTTYSLALYYMMDTPVQNVPLLQSFVEGDDIFRNSRFKLIPYISKGSWIVKQSVGKKACLVGQALEINYFRGKNYLELGVDIGSSTVARGVVSLVLGYLNNLVIEMAFLVQGNTEEELPEFLLGTCRLNHLDASKAVSIPSW